MKERSQENRSPFNGRTVDYRILTASFMGSVLVHAILIGMLFVRFDRTPRIAAMPSAISVTMISMGELPKAAPAPAKKANAVESSPQWPEEPEAPLVTAEDLAAMEFEESVSDANEPEPAAQEPPVQKPEIAAPAEQPEAPAQKEPALKKPALKKPTDIPKPIPPKSKDQVVIKDAPKVEEPPPVKEKPAQKSKTTEVKPKAAKPKPKVVKPNARKVAKNQKSVVSPSTARSESIKEAINRVRARAKQTSGSQSGGSTLADKRTGSADRGSGGAGGVTGGTGQAGGMTGPMNDIYKAQISYQIERNWAFSANLAGGRKDLRTILVITILPTGQIQNLWYEQRSGNNFLDQSAYNAVMKSNPLPPLPKGYPEYTIALVFTPAGLN
jgi:colicin import membrane protein